ncbi:Non-LTR retroelement reverse transcriptase [Gossypium australe]|uniref:Non-LTR retroelement reverse transcriptase n=1 Tax=Gossypium australe TaxID=47621 RepID=A0A5B6W883_9ROSI|nr:Non-LTR retroelement reverse transcriptase [Gossypium australe]
MKAYLVFKCSTTCLSLYLVGVQGTPFLLIRNVCGDVEESCLHVLRDCCQAIEVWKQLIPSRISNRFFSSSLDEWLSSNLKNKVDVVFQDVNWPSLFRIVCWRIWKQRNLCVFQDVHVNIFSVIELSWWWARSIKQGHGETICIEEGMKDGLPPTGLFKLNTDGAYNPNLGITYSVVMARYEQGRNIRRCSVLQAELWAIYDGFQIAWEDKWENVY